MPSSVWCAERASELGVCLMDASFVHVLMLFAMHTLKLAPAHVTNEIARTFQTNFTLLVRLGDLGSSQLLPNARSS